MRFESGSWRFRRQPQTMSRSSASSFATSAGMSAGSFCRSPSEVTTTSPRERSKPAEKAAVWPKLRRRSTGRTRGIPRLEGEELLPRAVGAAVVHQHQLERAAGRRQGRGQLPVEVLDVLDLVVERDDDGDLGARFSVHARPSISDGPDSAVSGRRRRGRPSSRGRGRARPPAGRSRAGARPRRPSGLPARQQGEVGDRPAGHDDRDDRRERVHGERPREVEGEEPPEGAGRAAGRAGQPGEPLEDAERQGDAVEPQQPHRGCGERARSPRRSRRAAARPAEPPGRRGGPAEPPRPRGSLQLARRGPRSPPRTGTRARRSSSSRTRSAGAPPPPPCRGRSGAPAARPRT